MLARKSRPTDPLRFGTGGLRTSSLVVPRGLECGPSAADQDRFLARVQRSSSRPSHFEYSTFRILSQLALFARYGPYFRLATTPSRSFSQAARNRLSHSRSTWSQPSKTPEPAFNESRRDSLSELNDLRSFSLRDTRRHFPARFEQENETHPTLFRTTSLGKKRAR